MLLINLRLAFYFIDCDAGFFQGVFDSIFDRASVTEVKLVAIDEKGWCAINL